MLFTAVVPLQVVEEGPLSLDTRQIGYLGYDEKSWTCARHAHR
jgi:hypothetical protein